MKNDTIEVLEEYDKSLLISLSKDITSCITRQDLQRVVTNNLHKYFHFNDAMICLNNQDALTHEGYVAIVSKETTNHPDFTRGASMKYFINDGIFNIIEDAEEPVTFDMDELIMRSNRPWYVSFWNDINVKEIIGFPVSINNECIGGLTLYPKSKNSFSDNELNLVFALCQYIGIALTNIVAYERIVNQLKETNSYKAKLEEENLYLQEQIKITYNYDEVIGSKNGLRETFQLITNVAPSDSTVLILGETGTGKELIASAIHNASTRKGRPLIKVNCAALPVHLIESELFGHEKGSFTGATDRRIGKFELANNGTIFLDEIGEMPLELQVKLLRVIQEREFERVGGKAVIKSNVRIIAATNRNLQIEADAGRFRADLFYRLNVFPITLPPLRKRKEDIPMLVSHFIDKVNKKSGKKVTNVSAKVVKEMTLYNWPGNVRELEHVIERSVLMTTGNIISEVYLPLSDKKIGAAINEDLILKTLEENERSYILEILKKSNGKVRGTGGAAEILNIPPTTLHSKMKKLGIKKTVT